MGKFLIIFGLLLVLVVGLVVWKGFSPRRQRQLELSVPASIPYLAKPKETEIALSVEKIFSGNKDYLASLDKDKLTTLVVTGDVIPARSVNFMQNKFGFDWAGKKVGSEISQGDITFVNLETPLLKDCPLTNEGMVFCGSSKNIEILKQLGADVVNLGNNHAGNYGVAGVEETIALLKSSGIETVGAQKANLVVKEVAGVKFGFLGFNDITKMQPGVSNVVEASMSAQIKKARKMADVVIVQFHWGEEYRPQPDERQIELGHLAIDSGADLVIGNHPHWIQPIEMYQGKLITYAHGNLIFDQEWSEKTKIGIVGKYYFLGEKLIDVEYLPIKIQNYGQPYFLEGVDRQKVLDEMKKNSGKQSL